MSRLQRHVPSCVAQQRLSRFTSSSRAEKSHAPLRVLFCGSDAFSIYSLRALDAFRRSSPSVIESIDVLCRPDKRAGRGLKQINAVPIKGVSQELQLMLHQLDTFKDWTPPSAIDLIVTASFGLLVPASILDHAKHGGLNVHPSLLPQFRGAAPIQHAIIRRVKTTGVSVQTMHPTKFDHGIVLAQEEVTMQEPTATTRHVTTAGLIERLGPIGGYLLVDSIRKGLFLQPKAIGQAAQGREASCKAPKITPSDRMIDWKTWTGDDILARDGALSQLWDRTSFIQCDAGSSNKRIIYKGPWSQSRPASSHDVASGTPVLLDESTIAWTTVDGAVVWPSAATIEGEAKDQGLKTMRRLLKSIDSV